MHKNREPIFFEKTLSFAASTEGVIKGQQKRLFNSCFCCPLKSRLSASAVGAMRSVVNQNFIHQTKLLLSRTAVFIGFQKKVSKICDFFLCLLTV